MLSLGSSILPERGRAPGALLRSAATNKSGKRKEQDVRTRNARWDFSVSSTIIFGSGKGGGHSFSAQGETFALRPG